MEKMVLPIFEKRFSQKFTLLRKRNPEAAQKTSSIKTEADCVAYGSDCIVAIDRFNQTIQRLYRVFSVLNKDFAEQDSSFESRSWRQYIGTLLTNLNFQFDSEDFDWKPTDLSLTGESKSIVERSSIASNQLEEDLANLLRYIIPTGQMSLTDIISFLGYSDITGDISGDSINSESSEDCSSRQTASEVESITKTIAKLENMKSLFQTNKNCDLNHYLQRWNSYLQSQSQGFNRKRPNCDSGIKLKIYMLFIERNFRKNDFNRFMFIALNIFSKCR